MNPPNHWQRDQDIEWPFGSGNKAGTFWSHKLVPGFHVIRSLSTLRSGEKWIHVSVSRRDRLPTWAELSKVKNEFMGPELEAYQVLAANKDHVNLHANCLHLWAPVDGVRRIANLQNLEMEESL
jgi:hypothetical protein